MINCLDAVVRKTQEVILLRKHVREEMLQTFYIVTIRKVLTFGMPCWGGNASKQDKNRLGNKNITKAGG